MDINVLFFGVLADVTGMTRKHYRNVRSFSDLEHRIEDDFPEVVHYNFLVVVNNRINNKEPVLRGGEEVIYLPPFAGG